MNIPVRISLVSYLNSRPFLYGLRHSTLARSIELQLDNPAVCADKLIQGSVDIGLVPAAILPKLPDYQIVSEYCIGAFGPVESVLLVSDVPLESISSVWLDYQSRTSVSLVRILAEQLWHITPEWHPATPGFEEKIAGSQAAVIIGDRAFKAARSHPYVYDLAEAWTELTGKPFVFAVWASRTRLDAEFISAFNAALSFGLSHLDQVVSAETETALSPEALRKYLTHSIRFNFDSAAQEGLAEFLHRQSVSLV